jgi:hypothetical protein
MMRITRSAVEDYLRVVNELIESAEVSAVTFVTDDHNFTSVTHWGEFSYPGFVTGAAIGSIRPIAEALHGGRSISCKLDHIDYVTDYNLKVYPLYSDEEENMVIGTWGSVVAARWPDIEAFENWTRLVGNEFAQGAMFYLCDREKFLCRYESDNYVMVGKSVSQVGDKLSPNGIALKAMEKKQRLSGDLPTEIYNTPVRVTANPIIDRKTGLVKGAVGLALNREMATDLQNVIRDIVQSMDEINGAIGLVAKTANQSAERSRELNDRIQGLMGITKTIDSILLKVKNISDQTKMLGLNAAIEAARAGETGRGFAVVAGEVRKLSEESMNTVNEIKKFVGQISETLQGLGQQAMAGMEGSEEQASAIEEITAGLQEIEATIRTVEKVAQKL